MGEHGHDGYFLLMGAMEAKGRMKDAIEAGQQMVALESASAY